MLRRKRMNPRTDRKVFARTATRTKKINIRPIAMRGGTRL